MPSEIAALMSRIEPDPWRSKTGFSPEIAGNFGVNRLSMIESFSHSALLYGITDERKLNAR
jgi:hypothetical protein